MRYISCQIRLNWAMAVLSETVVSQLDIQLINQTLNQWINLLCVQQPQVLTWSSETVLIFTLAPYALLSILPVRDSILDRKFTLNRKSAKTHSSTKSAFERVDAPTATTNRTSPSIGTASNYSAGFWFVNRKFNNRKLCRERSNSSRWCHTTLLTDSIHSLPPCVDVTSVY